jgi:hypothetical protein
MLYTIRFRTVSSFLYKLTTDTSHKSVPVGNVLIVCGIWRSHGTDCEE